MAELTAIATALKTALVAGVPTLVDRVHDYPPDSVVVPAALVGFPEIEYDATMDNDSHVVRFPVRVLVSRALDSRAWAGVAPYIVSVKAALENDRDLGSVVLSTRVTSARIVSATMAGVDYAAADFDVEIYTVL